MTQIRSIHICSGCWSAERKGASWVSERYKKYWKPNELTQWQFFFGDFVIVPRQYLFSSLSGRLITPSNCNWYDDFNREFGLSSSWFRFGPSTTLYLDLMSESSSSESSCSPRLEIVIFDKFWIQKFGEISWRMFL